MGGCQDARIAVDQNPKHFECVFGSDFSRDEVYINGHTDAKADAGKEKECIVRLLKDEPPELKKEEAHIHGIDEVKAHLRQVQVHWNNGRAP